MRNYHPTTFPCFVTIKAANLAHQVHKDCIWGFLCVAPCCPIWCPILKLLEIQRFPGSPPGGANTVAGGTPALQRHGSRGEEGLGWEGEEGEEVDLRANGEATWEAKGVGEQEEQAVHGEAKGPTKRQHKGLRPRNGRGLSSLNNWKNMSNYPILKYNWTAVLIIIVLICIQ